jgi:replication factor C subunit 2/4
MEKSISWVEKYRPSKLDEICSQTSIIQSLKKAIEYKNIPHLIFFGPTGCGKTSTIRALGNDLFGKYYNERVIEFDASDERGINVIREKIKTYAKQTINNINNIPPWKLIILDEADTMTNDSQFALRRIIEQYSKITRFCIICNYYNKIIDPIISRCSLFRFKPIQKEIIYNKLSIICKLENINYTEDIINSIIDKSRGDMRKSINMLQKCYYINNNNITDEMINDLSGLIYNDRLILLMTNVFNKDIKQVNNIINELYNDGYFISNQILLFHNYFLKLDIANNKKSKILCKLCEIDQNLLKGCDEYIQFINFIYYIMVII